MKKPFEIVELFLDPEQGLDGTYAISIVSDPAMESNFALFDKKYEAKFKKIDGDKQLIMGAALIPNKMILRRFKDNMAYVYFSPETIRQSSELFMKNSHQNSATLEHEIQLQGMTIVESWIIEDEVHDKSRKYGMEYPIGTWMMTMKVDDEVIWNDIVKTGIVKGFSIEGLYSKGKPKLSKDELLYNQLLSLVENITE